MALEPRHQCGAKRDLLVPVEGVGVEAVVVDADAVVRVARRHRHLDHRRQQVGGRAGVVELGHRRVAQVEPRLRGAEHQPDDEDGEQDQE